MQVDEGDHEIYGITAVILERQIIIGDLRSQRAFWRSLTLVAGALVR
jgi:hypothetical protein